MDDSTEAQDRLLAVPEREMVARTRLPALDGMTKADLQALGKRLREARDRSRRIASQQQREMRGKTDPRGAVPARDNTGSEAKTAMLVEALKRVTAALRKLNQPSMTQALREALEAKNAAVPHHPNRGSPSGEGDDGEDEQAADRADGPARGWPRVAGHQGGAGEAGPVKPVRPRREDCG